MRIGAGEPVHHSKIKKQCSLYVDFRLFFASITESRRIVSAVILLADKLRSTVAPANAAFVLTGIGAQRSSQISTTSVNPEMFVTS